MIYDDFGIYKTVDHVGKTEARAQERRASKSRTLSFPGSRNTDQKG